MKILSRVMGIFDFIHRHQIKVEWEYQSKGVLWRLLPAENGLFFGEERDLERKEVSFFCLAQTSGIPLWKDAVFPEKWWIGLEAVQGDTVILHEYAVPDMPEHKKIIALDVRTGSCKWMHEDLVFVFATGASVYGKKNLYDAGRIYEMNSSDGIIVREIDAGMFSEIRASHVPHDSDLEFPRLALNEDMPAGVQDILRKNEVELSNLVGIEFLEFENVGVVSWHEHRSHQTDGSNFRQDLRIVKDGKIRYSDCVAEQVSAVIPELFFRWGKRIFYIKERKFLRSVPLPLSLA